MKRLMLLMQTVLQECGTRCGISTELDWKTIERRVTHEGLEFLTITLADFCKVFEKALEEGQSVPSEWVGFTTRGATPVFLGQFMDLVFDRETGRLVQDILWDDIDHIVEKKEVPEGNFFYPWSGFTPGSHSRRVMFSTMTKVADDTENAIASVRQITRLFSKLEIEATERRIEKAFNDFLDCEKELAAYLEKGWALPKEEFDDLNSIGRLLYGKVFYELSKRASEHLSDTAARSWFNR
jgi:hypothetical protein